MRPILAIAILAVGCSGSVREADIPLLGECFSQAAYEAYRAEVLPSSKPQTCCGKCNNTGKVRSGDGLSIVPCPCPQTCKCKTK